MPFFVIHDIRSRLIITSLSETDFSILLDASLQSCRTVCDLLEGFTRTYIIQLS